MFTADSRAALQERLIAAARADERVLAAALVGSTATGERDEWSDIDLALCCVDAPAREDALAAWTATMYRDEGAADHVDIRRGPIVYRVFVLADSLQVDLSWWTPERFAPTSPRFTLVFGDAAGEPLAADRPAAARLVGETWLYLLHLRSSVRRGRGWQAQHFLAGARDRLVALACRRHGLPENDARGADELPIAVRDALAATVCGALASAPLNDALRAGAEALLAEAAAVDPALAERLRVPLAELTA